ncbi:DUF1850 domain-containing protein [Allosalinactinospora lopnorensis]|uniref:DUF1850 domain-containing protein n=1 Tax=Allosalinactinospora lopnorensis TaxID=1352348 RepID=UPI000623E8E5|nr:DUF1850 domain-containing protein [Allosalinactinospora lopnorensis]
MKARTAVVAITALLTTALLWPVWPALSIGAEGSRIGHVPLDSEGGFTVSFIHSLDKLPVEDVYVVRDGRVVQDATRLRQFGAGMGHIPGEGSGHAEGDWWVVSDLDRPIDDFKLRVGSPGADHRLVHPGGEIPLSQCWAGESLTLRPVKLPTLVRLLPTTRPPACPEGTEDASGNETS